MESCRWDHWCGRPLRLVGGYLGLYQEGAVRWDRLPVWERQSLEAAKSQLAQDVRQASGVKLARLKLYLSPDDTLNATAYGAGCISVTRGTLNSADPLALNGSLRMKSPTLFTGTQSSAGRCWSQLPCY